MLVEADYKRGSPSKALFVDEHSLKHRQKEQLPRVQGF